LLANADTKARHVFALALAFGVGGVAITVAAVATAAGSVHPVSGTSDQVGLAGMRFTYPTVNGAGAVLLVVAAVGLAAVAVAIRASRRQYAAYRGLLAGLRRVKKLERDPRVNVIADPRAHAFCAGYLRPGIYVSQRTIDLLTPEELDAVLAHEHHHRRVHDPLRVACGRILSEALFFVPILRPLSDRYADLAELSADRAATQTEGGERALASALLVFDDDGRPGVSGISPERVDSLLGRPVQWQLPLGRLSGAIATLSAIGVLLWSTSLAASAHASFNLPILSSQPCLMLMSLLPVAAGLWLRVRTTRAGALKRAADRLSYATAGKDQPLPR
jgi:hypothetical protein